MPVRSWKDLTDEEFAALAESTDGKRLADLYHADIYGEGQEHSIVNSCACTHRAVENLLGMGG